MAETQIAGTRSAAIKRTRIFINIGFVSLLLCLFYLAAAFVLMFFVMGSVSSSRDVAIPLRVSIALAVMPFALPLAGYFMTRKMRAHALMGSTWARLFFLLAFIIAVILTLLPVYGMVSCLGHYGCW
jgi:hypothetical protein